MTDFSSEPRGFDPSRYTALPDRQDASFGQHSPEQWKPQQEQGKRRVVDKIKAVLGRQRERPHSSSDEARAHRISKEIQQWAPETHGKVTQVGQRAKEVVRDAVADPGGTLLDGVAASQRMAEEADRKNEDRSWLQKRLGSTGGKILTGGIDLVWSGAGVYSAVDIANFISGVKAFKDGKDIYGKHMDGIDTAAHLLGSAAPWVPSTAVIEGTRAVRKWLHNKNDRYGATLRNANQAVVDSRRTPQHNKLPRAPHEIPPHGSQTRYGPPPKW